MGYKSIGLQGVRHDCSDLACTSGLFDDDYFDWNKVIPHCSSDLHFFNN